jgi:hypothetical protein
MTYRDAKRVSGLRGDRLVKAVAEEGYYVQGGKLHRIDDDVMAQTQELLRKKERNVRHDMVDGLMDFGRQLLGGVDYVLMTEADIDQWGIATAWAIPEAEPIYEGSANLHLISWRARPAWETWEVIG